MSKITLVQQMDLGASSGFASTEKSLNCYGELIP